MTRFPTAGHLASWAGTCPGSNESAGRVKSTKTRPGNPYLQGSARCRGHDAARRTRTPTSAPATGASRPAAARQKANVAIQHSMLIAIWHMGRTGTLYDDPGADFFTRLHPERAKNRALHQLEAMGYEVTLARVG